VRHSQEKGPTWEEGLRLVLSRTKATHGAAGHGAVPEVKAGADAGDGVNEGPGWQWDRPPCTRLGMPLPIWGRQQLDASPALSSLLPRVLVQKRWHLFPRGGSARRWERRTHTTLHNQQKETSLLVGDAGGEPAPSP